MSSTQSIINKFGGQTALAQLLGKNQSTIQYWVKSGSIPIRWHKQLLDLAQEQGIELFPGDFIENDELELSTDIPKPLPLAKWPGVLTIGSVELPVYVLEDGSRVITRNGATIVLTRRRSGDLESYLGVEALKGYLPAELPGQMVEFVIPEMQNVQSMQNKTIKGMSAETFLEICTAYVRALDDGKLQTPRQREIAVKAGMFLASCAKVGLVALIDEATGYQYTRENDALQLKLRLFLAEEMRKWETTFPEELWREFGRLTNWSGPLNQRPKYWGRLVMELIYEYLDSDVAEWLRKNNPNPKKGQNHHQWLTSQYGVRKLLEHIWMVIGMAKTCHSMLELKTKMAELYGRQPIQYTLFIEPPTTKPAQPPNTKQLPRPGSKSSVEQIELEIYSSSNE